MEGKILTALLMKSEDELKELERLAEIGRAVEKATEKGVAWVFLDSICECTYPSEEDIQHLVLWNRL